MGRFAKLEIEDSQGAESTTPGVFGTAFYLPSQEALVNPGAVLLDRSDEQRGVDGALPLASDEFNPVGSIRMRSYATYIGALLMTLFGDVTTTPGGGGVSDPEGGNVPAGAYKHVFVKKSGALPKSARLTLGYGDEFVRSKGLCIEEIAWAIAAGGVEATAGCLANYFELLEADPGIVPSYEDFAKLPWRRRNVKLSWGVGTKNIESVGMTMRQDLEPNRNLGNRSAFPSDTERTNTQAGFLRLTGTLVRRELDHADIRALLDASAFAVTVGLLSEQNLPSIARPAGLWVEAPHVQLTEGTLEALKSQPRHEFNMNWLATYDFAQGYDFRVTLVNDVAAYK